MSFDCKDCAQGFIDSVLHQINHDVYYTMGSRVGRHVDAARWRTMCALSPLLGEAWRVQYLCKHRLVAESAAHARQRLDTLEQRLQWSAVWTVISHLLRVSY